MKIWNTDFYTTYDVIRDGSRLLFVVQIIFVNKKGENVIVDILMSQDWQFMKVYTVYKNPKAVATFFINKNVLCYHK